MLNCKPLLHRGITLLSHRFENGCLSCGTSRGSEEEDRPGLLELQVFTEKIIRLRFTEEEAFKDRDHGSRVLVPQEVECNLTESDEKLLLQTPALQVEITKKTAAVRWLDAEGGLLTAEPEVGGKWLKPMEILKPIEPGDVGEMDVSVDGIKARIQKDPSELDRMGVESFMTFVPQKGEALYGLGQHEDGVFNYRGKSQHLYQSNMKVSVPTLVSSRGYAIHLDHQGYSLFESDDESFSWRQDSADQLDYFFLAGPEMDDLMAGLRQLTGGMPMLPLWSYGFLQSKERYESAAELVEVISKFRDQQVPIDGIILDWQSWAGDLWGQKTFDPERFPDPAGMMRELHRLNSRLMISIWPNMFEGGDNHADFEQAGQLLANGSTYDAFDPEARERYWQQCRDGLFQYGVDAWWCDCTEPFEADWNGSFRRSAVERMLINTREFKRYLDPAEINAYSLHHSRGIYEGQRATDPSKRVLNLTRSAATSQQRYGTVTWSGDIEARWSRLRKQLADGLNFVMTGNPRWTFDIGGFFVKPGVQWFWDGQYPEGNQDLGYCELYTRWFQTGCFLPMFRSHGTDTAREIWNFGEPGTPFYDTIKRFTELRYHLLPYLYSVAAMEVFDDYTMFRSLVFDFRNDQEVLEISDQFLCGPSLMVCPVLEPQQYGPHSIKLENSSTTRRVYLPKGADWVDFWTDETFSGGQWMEVEAPLERLPLFVKAGSILPMGPVLQHSGEMDAAKTVFHIYPGANADFVFYEDSGDGYEYEHGAYCRTSLRWMDQEGELQISNTEGSYPSRLDTEKISLMVHTS